MMSSKRVSKKKYPQTQRVCSPQFIFATLYNEMSVVWRIAADQFVQNSGNLHGHGQTLIESKVYGE